MPKFNDKQVGFTSAVSRLSTRHYRSKTAVIQKVCRQYLSQNVDLDNSFVKIFKNSLGKNFNQKPADKADLYCKSKSQTIRINLLFLHEAVVSSGAVLSAVKNGSGGNHLFLKASKKGRNSDANSSITAGAEYDFWQRNQRLTSRSSEKMQRFGTRLMKSTSPLEM